MSNPYFEQEEWDALVEHFGCPTCQRISLYGAHVCEHGVTACDPVTIELTLTTTTDIYDRYFQTAED